MKKQNSFYSILLIAVAAVMITSTAVSFAFWKSGIEGNNTDKNLDITIGEGDSYLTTVSLQDVSGVNGGKRLIPSQRTPSNADEVTFISFTVTVTWNPGQVPSSSDEAFATARGQLTVSCVSILNPNDENMLNASGFSGLPLFVCASEQPSYDIYGSASVDVTITVRMNEPANKVQYDKVAGRDMRLTLNFLIQSPDDLAQQISE